MRYQLYQPLIIDRKRHPKRWTAMLVGFILIAILIVRIVANPATGHSTTVDITAKKSTHTQAKTIPAGTVDNQYFHLPLPTGYKLATTQTNTGDALLADTVSHAALSGTQLVSIAIVTAPTGGVSELSNYRSRQQSGNYSFSSQKIGETTVTIATRLDGVGGEVTAFWPRGSYLATIAVSTNLGGPTDTPTNQVTLRTMLAAWQWK